MSTSKLEEKRGDYLHNSSDEDLRVVTGGSNMVFCLYNGAMYPTDGFYTTKEGCKDYYNSIYPKK